MNWIALPERRPAATLAAIALLFTMAYGASLVWLSKPGGRIVLGDALHQYVQLRSAVFDRDLRFTNEYLRLYGLTPATLDSETHWIVETNETGHIRNLMPVGPALLWAPAFLLTTATVWIADHAGWHYPLDGYGRAFQASAAFTGIIAAWLGAWLSYCTARRLFSQTAAIWATLAMWLASSAVYYSVISPTYSHAASMCAVSAFFWYWLRDESDRVQRYARLGALAGIAALMRWQDAVLLVIPGVDALWRLRRTRLPGALLRVLTASTTAVAAFVPQMIVWDRLYGHPLTIPQGASFMQWGHPALLAVLVSDNHGLLSWTPIVALAAIGFVFLARCSPRIAAGTCAFVLISWYVNASVADWWAGEAFGARRFVACFPAFVLGLSALFDRWRAHPARVRAVTLVFVGLTFLLLVQYQAFMHGARSLAPYPRGVDGLWLARFRVPFTIVRAWMAHRLG